MSLTSCCVATDVAVACETDPDVGDTEEATPGATAGDDAGFDAVGAVGDSGAVTTTTPIGCATGPSTAVGVVRVIPVGDSTGSLTGAMSVGLSTVGAIISAAFAVGARTGGCTDGSFGASGV